MPFKKGNTGFGGRRHTEKTKAKMSAARRGRHHSIETKEKMHLSQMGRNVSPEIREKMLRGEIQENRCSICKQLKPLSEFSKNRKKWNKISSQCKECAGKYQKKWYGSLDLEKRKERSKKSLEWHRKNPIVGWCNSTIFNHRERGITVNITVDELKQYVSTSTNCPICGVSFKWPPGQGAMALNSSTLDRVNNERIMTLDNVMIICASCNRTKGKRTMREFKEYCSLTHQALERMGF